MMQNARRRTIDLFTPASTMYICARTLTPWASFCEVDFYWMKNRIAISILKRCRISRLLCLATIVAASGLHAQQSVPSQRAADLADGKAPFASSCVSCHGLDGRGTERGPDIASRKEVQSLSDAALVKIVSEGVTGTGMPPFRSLGKTRIESIVGYLRTLQGRGEQARMPGNPAEGKPLFFGKAECSTCHTVQGSGGFIGSDLSNYAANRSAEEIRRAVSSGPVPPNRANTRVVVTNRNGTKLSGVVRNEDNFSLQLQTLEGAFYSVSKAECRIESSTEPIMPADYGSRLTKKEIDDLVSYLLDVSRKSTEVPKPAGHRKSVEESE